MSAMSSGDTVHYIVEADAETSAVIENIAALHGLTGTQVLLGAIALSGVHENELHGVLWQMKLQEVVAASE